MSDALAAFDKIAQSCRGCEAFALYHKALALASVGDFEGADEILSAEREPARRCAAASSPTPRSSASSNATPMRSPCWTATSAPSPIRCSTTLRARLAAGETLPFDIARNATDGMAEVFFTVATALNGEAADGYTLIYARVAALSCAPTMPTASFWPRACCNSRASTDLAIETYALIPPDRPVASSRPRSAGPMRCAGGQHRCRDRDADQNWPRPMAT